MLTPQYNIVTLTKHLFGAKRTTVTIFALQHPK
jgi:hypothetical protein